ncbi:MAG: OsmC family protein [Gaiellaceae bacterium]
MSTQAKTFEYSVEVDRAGRMTVPGGAQVESPEGWSPDHLLLAALVRCSIESFTYHARRAGHEVAAAGSAQGTVARRSTDGRFAFAEIDLRIDVQLTPRTSEPADLIAKAERDCFVGASLTIEPRYEWHVS